jgi:hypothetical protein
MASRKTKSGGVYAYLEQAGAFEIPDKDTIAQLKKQYWAAYKKEFKKRQRQISKSFTVICTLSEAETLIAAAKAHRYSVPKFIKRSCQAYLQQQYLVPDRVGVAEIFQVFTAHHCAMQQLIESNIVPFWDGVAMLRRIDALEAEIRAQLYAPKVLEQAVVAAVAKDPAYKDILCNILNQV